MIITQTPLRISFFGGGTDYPEYFEKYGGAVLGTAVNFSAFFSVFRFYSELFDYSIRISSRQVECVSDVGQIQHAPFRECLKWCGVLKNIEIDHASELPAFTGLGSSSTFVVGLLNSLHAYTGQFLSPMDLAYQAIELERSVLKESVGCQDQTFAALGGINLIEFKATDHIVPHPVLLSPERLNELESHLVLVFTGIKRKAEEMAAKTVHNIGANLKNLDEMKRMVEEGYRILVNGGDLLPFGSLLHKAWTMKRELAEGITNPLIEQCYSDALEAGAVGGKLLGAGGGGFLLLFVPPDKRVAVLSRLKEFKVVDFKMNAPGSRIVFS